MASTPISVKADSSIASIQDVAGRISEAKSFSELFSVLSTVKYATKVDDTQINYKEAIAIIVNSLNCDTANYNGDFWNGAVVEVDDESQPMIIEERSDSRVKIPVQLINDDEFRRYMTFWNSILGESKWPWPSIPENYGLRRKVMALAGHQIREELSNLARKTA